MNKPNGRNDLLRRLWPLFSKRDKIKLLALVLIQIVLSLLDLLGVLVVGLLGILAINGVQSVSPQGRVAWLLSQIGFLDSSLQVQVGVLGSLAALLFVGKTIASIILGRKSLLFLSRRSAELSTTLISKMLSQTADKLELTTSHDKLFAITSGVHSITVGVVGTAVALISDGLLLTVMVVGLLVVDPVVALSSLVGFGLLGMFLYRIMFKKVGKLARENAALTIKSNEKILEVLQSYREAFVGNRLGSYVEEISSLRYKIADSNAEISFFPNISKYVIESVVVIAALLLSAVQFLTNDAATAIGTLSIFLAAGTRVAPAVLRAQQGALSIRHSMANANSTLDYLDSLSEKALILINKDPLDFNHLGFEPRIEMRGVYFSYPGNSSSTLSEINLDIEAGTVVAIVGSSGAGKSTLADLILGVIEPDLGQVYISGVSPREAISFWPGAISYVPQNIAISNSSIQENILRGVQPTEDTKQRAQDALLAANLTEFAASKSDTPEYLVGENGNNLSGGQKQRLGIARALFSNPKLIVLDEATSALDAVTERAISEMLHELKMTATVILVAHRLSTIRNADLIVYIQDGQIKATGTFSEVKSQVSDFAEQARLIGL